MTDFTPATTHFTGRRAALIIVAFFGVIIAVNGLMLTLAVQTFGGLVVGNSYVASQNFNEDVAAARAQPIREWQLDVATDAQTVTLTMRDRNGTALRGLAVALTIDRPTHERDTVTVDLTETAPGIYSVAAALLPGKWVGTVRVADGQTRSLDFTSAVPAS